MPKHVPGSLLNMRLIGRMWCARMCVAEELGIADQTVCKWRARFIKKRVAGLLDEPRPGVPRKITDDQVEAVILKARAASIVYCD